MIVYVLHHTETMAERDPVAAAAQKYKPIQSAVPGTTLGPIQINAFVGGEKLYDTPGVHLHHRQAAVVHSDDLPALAPQNRLRGQSFDISTLPTQSSSSPKGESLNGYTFFWGGLVRIDILKALPETCFTFYGPKALEIHAVPTKTATAFYEASSVPHHFQLRYLFKDKLNLLITIYLILICSAERTGCASNTSIREKSDAGVERVTISPVTSNRNQRCKKTG
jgi:hypothetical protein